MTKEEIRFAIDYLNKMMPEWDYEANVYCADAYHGLGELICDEPQGYVFKTAIEALENVDKYKWHDLRKNPNDLPIYEKPYWCVIETVGKTLYDSKIKREYTVLGRYQILNLKEFVIAWREIDRFEEVTE